MAQFNRTTKASFKITHYDLMLNNMYYALM